MLKFYVAIAHRLYRIRALAWTLAAVSIAGFGATLFFSEGQADEAYMLASMAVLLWALCLLVVVYTFIEPLPQIEAVRLASHWVLRATEVMRLTAQVVPGNEPSLAVLRTAGFTEEGVLREWLRRGDEHVDVIQFSLLSSDLDRS